MSGHHFNRLSAGIIARSRAGEWEQARREWRLTQVYFVNDPPAACLCGHRPIKEICELYNRETDHHVMVGNVCVNRFVGLDSERIFSSFRRIADDEETGLNENAIDYAFRRALISNWERAYLLNTFRKRRLSPKQIDKRRQINRRLLRKLWRRDE